jgi:putative ABC transport system substrate-binding protein
MIGTQTMWTTERIALLKNRFDAGLSCGQIAREIGVSRNAVIGTFALSARLATMHANREYIETGGLIAYGANYPDLFRRAGNYVDKILRGAKPADLPIERRRNSTWSST